MYKLHYDNGSEEEWVTRIYRRLATGEQGHNPELGVGLIVDEFAEAFAGRAIYSIGDLYSGYDQFQLVVESREIITMQTPIGLVWMCTLPQGVTNLFRTYDECDEQGASRLHSRDNDVVP